MKWFKKWVFRMTKEGSAIHSNDEQAKYANIPSASDPLAIGRPSKFEQNGMNFTLYKANGGYVMEYHTYDRKTDRTDNRLHIIPQDKDLGEQISHIITYEALQQ